MSHVIVTAVFSALPDHRDELIAALRLGIPAVHAEPGCELYAIHDADDGTIVMIERWTTRADLDAHAEGDAVQRLNELIGLHLAQPVAVVRMSPLRAGDEARGLL